MAQINSATYFSGNKATINKNLTFSQQRQHFYLEELCQTGLKLVFFQTQSFLQTNMSTFHSLFTSHGYF